jgi:WD40 repeat protein
MWKFIAFIVAAVVTSPVAQSQVRKLETTEKPLCEIDRASWQAKRYAFSNDLSHFAYATNDGTHEMVVVDGQPQPKYDAVSRPIFSPDGRRVAYAARKGDKWRLVVDRKEAREYDLIDHEHIIFTGDSKQVIYPATREGTTLLVIDSEEMKQPSMACKELKPNPDGTNIAGIFQGASGRWGVIGDGRKHTSHPEVYGLTFSPDGKHLAYIAAVGDGQRWQVIRDAKPGRAYNGIRELTFSPDGQHLSYVGVLNDDGKKTQFLVVDEKEGEDRFPEKLTYTPSGKPAYFIAPNAPLGPWSLIIGDEKQPIPVLDAKQYGSHPHLLTFGADDAHFSFVCHVFNASGPSPVINGVRGNPYVQVMSIAYSGDGKAVACVVGLADKKQKVVATGAESEAYDAVLGFRFDSASEGRFLAKKGGRIVMVIAKVPAGPWPAGRDESN